ncbi:PREDICTED: COP9 signalosome complex subunit 2-like [Nicrophorus vespilloides]|uniref:COP9 signalosome complex subunit 2-like n=1 Tax=Nicrophorus vespilloides TaxID=110193 RepID=A0ABM1NJF8_NICVS|nr:PREDICTED: COP9 signalosome complex subunit 2-like [Nicrophorus vespilloides]
MSDMYGNDDDDDYGMQYSEESTSEPDVDLENQYYQSKLIKEENEVLALTSFRRVIDLQGESKGEWGFKALKQMIKINFSLGHYEEMMRCYREMLVYIRSAVTKNQGEKAINSILEYTSTSNQKELLQEFYEMTLDALKDAKNDRLWFKTNCKLGKVYFDSGEFGKLLKIIKQLKQACVNKEGDEDVQKGNQLLEIYALEIQIYTEKKNNKLLRELYERALKIRSAIPHPMIMSTIRECGGKMHLRSEEYERAYADFFEAFKNYDESGSPRRIACLKYLILTSMLMKSTINPIDSQEVKPYRDDPDIVTMKELLMAFQSNNTTRFEGIFKDNRDLFLSDPFIREHIDGLFHIMRSNVLLKLIKPYKTIRLDFTAKELNITEEEAEHLIALCILNESIKGRIDAINRLLIIEDKQENVQYKACNKIVDKLDGIHKTMGAEILCNALYGDM